MLLPGAGSSAWGTKPGRCPCPRRGLSLVTGGRPGWGRCSLVEPSPIGAPSPAPGLGVAAGLVDVAPGLAGWVLEAVSAGLVDVLQHSLCP